MFDLSIGNVIALALLLAVTYFVGRWALNKWKSPTTKARLATATTSFAKHKTDDAYIETKVAVRQLTREIEDQNQRIEAVKNQIRSSESPHVKRQLAADLLNMQAELEPMIASLDNMNAQLESTASRRSELGSDLARFRRQSNMIEIRQKAAQAMTVSVQSQRFAETLAGSGEDLMTSAERGLNEAEDRAAVLREMSQEGRGQRPSYSEKELDALIADVEGKSDDESSPA